MSDKLGASANADRAATPSEPSPETVSGIAGIPCAERIMQAVKRAMEPLDSPNLSWPEYYRRLQATPDLVLHEIRQSGVLFRLPEQANWPLIIEAFEPRPYTLTVRTQLTVGGQTLGFDQQMDDHLLYGQAPMDHGLAQHMGKHAIRATLEAVAAPFYEDATVQFARAIEAHRAGTGETQFRFTRARSPKAACPEA